MSRRTENILSSQALCLPLPEEVIYEILTWLPVKSLIQFRCVSKSWNSIITNPIFITTHLDRVKKRANKNKNNGYLLFTPSIYSLHNTLHTVVCNSDNTFSLISSIEFPFKCRRITGFCNGMIYIYCVGSIIYLCNPSIRKFKKVVGTCLPDSLNCAHHVTVGLAYHSQSNDYKILRFMFNVHRVSTEERVMSVKAEVYTLSTDLWRKVVISVDSLSKSVHNIDATPCLFFNGGLHSIAYTPDHKFILSFDVNDESFCEIMLPQNYLDGISLDSEHLVVFKGLLALIVFEQSGICYIWLMQEYGLVESWTKRSIPVSGVDKFFGCTVNGEFLITKYSPYGFLSCDPKRIILLDPESLNEKKILGIPGNADVTYTANLMENLVLLNEVNVSSEDET